MSELTMEEARRALEKTAATLLGQLLFEFARLDVALGLCVVWTDEGRRLEELTKQVAEFSFHKKLDCLKQVVEQFLAQGSEGRAAYTQWMEHAHDARFMRNKLVHGRWGVDPIQQQVINVVGLPTSPDQNETRYSIQDLEKVLDDLKYLQVTFSELRNRWPIRAAG